ncbi:hypothetical protein BP5796_07141 [Coleophoma crateriformis]|uniref:Zn(2)-C6 fungal-type domain-containing protein n=1 Tax=Coleophoma crateriformis TaxID=565419 RepID=A0A3D8RI13_9HELO|nr:hypothetical protein BP5796_07141 [Coleophoma crateriformis]
MFRPQTQTLVQQYHVPEPEVDMSWSENTTPDYDDIEEIIRQPPSRVSAPSENRIRIMRDPIKKRRRTDEVPRTGWTGGEYHDFAGPLNMRCSIDGSDGSNSTALTIITSASSSCGDPWSASGIIEEDGEEANGDWDGDDAGEDKDGEGEDGSVLLPKIEPIDEEVDMAEVKEATIEESPRTAKRPRGRPRKYPKPTAESLAKVAKGRSKTGCVTCRRRKKKCDEAKPRCMNCEKNNAVCEGYPERSIWKSGKEKRAEEGTVAGTYGRNTGELIASTARIRRVSIPNIQLNPVLHAIETDGDRLFFHHYIYRLSCIFTVEGEKKNAFKDMMLPLAVQNEGLMHSILALAGRHINYRSNYGVKLLKDHPEVKESELQERCEYHKAAALKLFCNSQQEGEDLDDQIVSARFGQMICMVMDTLSNTDQPGVHRIHLQGYQRLIREHPPRDQEFLGFIKEFFDYHIRMDDLIYLPTTDYSVQPAGFGVEIGPVPPVDFKLPDPNAGDERMLGVCDGLLLMMSHITVIRNTIRSNIAAGVDPPVDCGCLCEAADIDREIRAWEPAMPPSDPRYPAALLYKQMAWVYLFRTIYVNGAAYHERLKPAVDAGLDILRHIPPSDQSQTLLLAPIFVLGCASYEDSQRQEIRKAIAIVKDYMQYRNSDSALEVLEEMWRLMDTKDPRSWDWQSVARSMGRDFLAT